MLFPVGDDCPVSPDQLDSVRVTLIHEGGGKSRLTTDRGYDGGPPQGVEHTWTRATILQQWHHPQRACCAQVTSAKQEGKQHQKFAKQKKIKNERGCQ